MVMISQTFAYVQTHQIVYSKYVQLFIYQVYLNKTVFEKGVYHQQTAQNWNNTIL